MRTFMKTRIIVAAMTVNFVQCINLYFGNLLPYIYSVYYTWTQETQHNMGTSWMFNVYLIFYVVGTLSVDLVRVRIGLNSTAIAGILVYDIGLLLTYFTVRHSVWASTATFMAMGGLGTGYLEAALFLYLAGWFPQRLGMATSLALTSNAVGGVVINFVVTAYINPEGYAPDARKGHILYFSQTDVVGRVPEIFLIIGISAVVLHVVGFSLIKAPPVEETRSCLCQDYQEETAKGDNYSIDDKQPHTSANGRSNEEETRSTHAVSHHIGGNGKSSYDIPYKDMHPFTLNKKEGENRKFLSAKTSISNGKLTEESPLCDSPRKVIAMSCINSKNEISEGPTEENQYHTERHLYNPEIGNHPNKKAGGPLHLNASEMKVNESPSDKTPRQVLRMEIFYYVNLSVLAEALANVVVVTYYKTFGLLWIADDHFFALLGSSSSFLNIGFQLGVGYLVDIFGVQNILIGHLAINSLFLCFWYFTASVNQWLYFIFSNVLLCLLASQYFMFPLVALKLFGPTHFPTNLGLILLTSAVAYLIASPLVTFLLTYLGWSWMFIITGGVFIIPLLLISTRISNSHETS